MIQKIRDSLDRNLIAALEENGRVSATQLGRELGVARSTINERIARLEREGVILGYTAIVQRQCETGEARSLLFLKCDRALMKRALSAFKRFPEIQLCYSITGGFDLVCYVETPQAEDLDALIDEMSQVSGVSSIESTIILSTRFTRSPEKACALGSQLKLVASH